MRAPNYGKFRSILDSKNMSDYAFCEQAGIPYTTINRWKNGNCGMTVETLSKVAEALSVDFADLFDEVDEALPEIEKTL